jgi:hypothetical protein
MFEVFVVGGWWWWWLVVVVGGCWWCCEGCPIDFFYAVGCTVEFFFVNLLFPVLEDADVDSVFKLLMRGVFQNCVSS